MGKFFVWRNKTSEAGEENYWEVINPWNVNETTKEMLLPLSTATKLTIEGDVNIGGKISVGGNVVGALNTETIISSGNITVNAPSAFQGYGTIPIGGIIMWSGDPRFLPDGWELCDGGTYIDWMRNQAEIPDLSGRFIVSYGSNGESNYSVGQSGGLDNKSLLLTNIPSHRHQIQLMTSATGGHKHPYQVHNDGIDENTYAIKSAGNSNEYWVGGYYKTYNSVGGAEVTVNQLGYVSTENQFAESGVHRHYIDGYSGYTGSGAAFDNRPKYYVLAYIIRVK